MCIKYFDENALNKWFKDNGDESHRINYNLNKDSLVFDLGGYIGDWSKKISDKYDCHIYVFEPVLKYFTILENKFKDNNKIKNYCFGLSNDNIETEIAHDGASSSVYLTNGHKEKIKLVSFEDFLKKENIGCIDLIKINIEGGEYELLEFILKNNHHKKIKNLQIQFHKMFDSSEERRDEIRKKLSKTHKLTYDYTFVWENWELI
jgi:FkbM family methyltransferase